MDGSNHEATGKYIKLSNGKIGIGIGLVDHTQVVTDPKVKIDAGSIGGPSAGMMFTLEIYSQITGKDLRQGREIAGTGTINEDGSIGQIGGVDKKLLQQVMRAQKFSFAQMKRKNRQRLLVQQITTQMRLRQLKS